MEVEKLMMEKIRQLARPKLPAYQQQQRAFEQRARMGRYAYANAGRNSGRPAKRILDSKNQRAYIPWR